MLQKIFVGAIAAGLALAASAPAHAQPVRSQTRGQLEVINPRPRPPAPPAGEWTGAMREGRRVAEQASRAGPGAILATIIVAGTYVLNFRLIPTANARQNPNVR